MSFFTPRFTSSYASSFLSWQLSSRPFMAWVSPCSGNFLRMVSAALRPFLYCLDCRAQREMGWVGGWAAGGVGARGKKLGAG